MITILFKSKTIRITLALFILFFINLSNMPVASAQNSTTIPEIDLTGDEDLSTVLFNPYPEPSLLSTSDQTYLENLTEQFNEEISNAIDNEDIFDDVDIKAFAASWGYPSNLVVVALGQNVNGDPVTVSVNAQSTTSLPQPSGLGIFRADFVTTFINETTPKDSSLTLFGTADPLVAVEPSIILSIDNNGVVKMEAGQFGESVTLASVAKVLSTGLSRVPSLSSALGTSLLALAGYLAFCDFADNTPPSIDVPTPDGSNLWHRSAVLVTVNDFCPFSCSIGSSVFSRIFPSAAQKTLSGDGEYMVFAQDINRNEASEFVGIDTSGPTVTKTNTFDVISGVFSVTVDSHNGNCSYSGLPFTESGVPRVPGSSATKRTNVSYSIDCIDPNSPCNITLTAIDVAGNSITTNIEIKCTPTPTPTPNAVTLLSFNAQELSNDNVLLIWETATEINNAGFNLYRARLKNGTYKKINKILIPAQGNAVSGASYSYVDTPPAKGTYYYKLEDVDYNGLGTMHGPEKVRVRK